MECGRCQDACPAFASGKPLSPKMIIFNLEKHLLENDGAVVARKAGRPGAPRPGVHHRGRDLDLHDLRRLHARLPGRDRAHPEDRRTPPDPGPHGERVPAGAHRLLPEHRDELQSLGDRLRQAGATGRRASDVPLLKDKPGAEYLFWVGCMGSFDDDGKEDRPGDGRAHEGGRDRTSPSSGPRRNAAATPPAGWGTNISSRPSPLENLETFRKLRSPEDRDHLPSRLQHLQERVPGSRRPHGRASRTRKRPALRSIEVVSHVELIAGLVASGATQDPVPGEGRHVLHLPRPLLPRPPQRHPRSAEGPPRPDDREHGRRSCRTRASTASAAAPAAG